MRSLAVAFIVLFETGRAACGCGQMMAEIQPSVNAILAEDKQAADAAIAELRGEGPSALQALVSYYESRQRSGKGAKQPPATSEELARLKAAIDRVGGQRDCAVSRLYWHTDLESAKHQARKLQKPILSLRMLGKLTDEFSCANSRFFRTTLYANEEVSRYLRNNFVLHWETVRPVPRVTIDFGDGRKLERTLTGNSIHYVLDSDGQPLDALPGLYGPKAFLRGLGNALAIEQTLQDASPVDRPALLVAYHQQRIGAIEAQWQQDMRQLGRARRVPSQAVAYRGNTAAKGKAPLAAAAAMIAAPKSASELPVIVAMSATPWSDPKVADDEELWKQLAILHAGDGKLDRASIRVIRNQTPTARRAGAVAVTKRRVEDPLVRVVRNFEGTIALDTVRNEYLLHRQLHDWFAAGSAGSDVKQLNERVYAELFLTPSSDPWLGLVPQDTYTALENDGRVTAAN